MEKEWLESLLKQDNDESISHILNIEKEPGVPEGENFASVLLRYKIIVVLKSGEKILKNYIVKTIPKCPKLATYCIETPVFKNEIFIYSVVLKEMEALMKEFNDKRGKLWCKLIGYRNNNQIILEDLETKNYFVMNRRDMLDLEHTLFALQSLARYHAMSAVLLKRNIIKPTDLGTLSFVSSERMIHLFFVSFFKSMGDTVQKYWGPDWSNLPEHLYRASTTAVDRYKNMAKFNESGFNVINHGDCWTNNLMFKHIPGTNTPSDLRFIDFQMSHCNSFAWDLTYFFYNSIRPDIRRSSYLDLLTAYHKALQEYLIEYSYSNEEIPTLDYIIQEMERLKFFGFGLLTSIHAFTSAETPNSYDLLLSYENEIDPAIGINTDIFTCKKYRNKIEDDMKAFIEQGVI